jgi:CheY-like chemotaxis protein
MTRVTLILWSPEEAARRAEELTASGFDVSVFSDRKSDPRALRHDPPDAFLIDLARSPAQGRELGGWLRRQKATRQRPLVFIEGDPEKTEKARALLPDAAFTTWESAAAEVSRAVAEAPKDPVVPGAMDAYAGASLVKKLGIREGHLVGLVDGPEGFEGLLRETPKGVRRRDESLPEGRPGVRACAGVR